MDYGGIVWSEIYGGSSREGWSVKSSILVCQDGCFDDVTIYWDTREYTCEGLYLLKGSETKYCVRFLVLIKVDKVRTDRFWRIGMGTWEDSSYEKSTRPFARSTPQTITLV